MLKKLNIENFETEVINNPGIALVDFYADWCGPCKMIAPIVESIANEHDDVVVGKLNIDEAYDIAVKYQVMSIPTLIVFKNGIEVSRSVGYRSKDVIEEMLDA